MPQGPQEHWSILRLVAASGAFPSFLRTACSLLPPTGQKLWDQRAPRGGWPLCSAPSLHTHRDGSLGSVTGHTGEADFFSVLSRQQRTGGIQALEPKPTSHTCQPWRTFRQVPPPSRCRPHDGGDIVLTHVRPRGSGNWWTHPQLLQTALTPAWALKCTRRNAPEKGLHPKATVTSCAERGRVAVVPRIDLKPG